MLSLLPCMGLQSAKCSAWGGAEKLLAMPEDGRLVLIAQAKREKRGGNRK